ncbi:MAG: sugar transferase [Candidatus Eremiobacteraeota bacterium]|nr:sugar transferase [Candidatus Eremiobacteraeota bacterium]
MAFFIIASALGALIGFHHWESQRIVGHLLVADAIFVALWVLLFDRLGLYRRTYALSMKDELYYTVAALILGTIPQLTLFTLYPEISTSRLALVFALGFSVVLVGGSRASLHHLRMQGRFGARRRTSIVGTIDRVRAVAESMDLPQDGDTLLLAVDDLDETLAGLAACERVDLDSIDWFARARTWGCDSLILTEIVPPQVIGGLLDAAAGDHISVAFAPPRITRFGYELSLQTSGHQALIVPARLAACTPRARLVKRFIDIVFGTIALIVFAPVMLAAALAVYLESGGPVLFTQQRIGRNGKPFNIIKFRSMRTDAEREVGAVWASPDDPRKTRVGGILRRLSIDEMPQLFNVLRGEMSLVGPRPERPIFVELFRRTLPRYDERHVVAPGITGWSQIHMKRILEPSAAAEKLDYDLQYIENWSPYLDISVLFQTACEFLFHRAG